MKAAVVESDSSLLNTEITCSRQRLGARLMAAGGQVCRHADGGLMWQRPGIAPLSGEPQEGGGQASSGLQNYHRMYDLDTGQGQCATAYPPAPPLVLLWNCFLRENVVEPMPQSLPTRLAKAFR